MKRGCEEPDDGPKEKRSKISEWARAEQEQHLDECLGHGPLGIASPFRPGEPGEPRVWGRWAWKRGEQGKKCAGSALPATTIHDLPDRSEKDEADERVFFYLIFAVRCFKFVGVTYNLDKETGAYTVCLRNTGYLRDLGIRPLPALQEFYDREARPIEQGSRYPFQSLRAEMERLNML